MPRDAHSVSRSQISSDALRVLYRLKDAGFEAYLVGGCVRDLLIGTVPKDFDVVTNALPEQVRRLFRNCRLVGRRFRLAHVMYGPNVIEVATFRAATPDADEDDVADDAESDADAESDDEFDADIDAEGDVKAAAAAGDDDVAEDVSIDAPADARPVDRMVDLHGRILRDNVYGNIDEDVWRRDFTANSLYYNIADFSIRDYVGGFDDALQRRLRLIGDPETRYREDPVRMLRAARFEAKLGFTLDPSTAEPIARLCELLASVPPARLFDETLKLFLAGHATRSLEVLLERGLLDTLLPPVARFLRAHPDSPPARMLRRALVNTDRRSAEGLSLSPTFLFCVLLYGPLAVAIEKHPAERWQDLEVILDETDTLLRAVTARVAIPRRFTLGIREMLSLQPRLESPRGRRALRLLEHPRFRSAFDLLQLRADFGMASAATAKWWSDLQREPDAQRRLALADARAAERGAAGAGAEGGAPRRRRRGGRGRTQRAPRAT